MRPVLPELPFELPASERSLDITLPLGARGAFTQLDPVTAAPVQHEVVNMLGAPNRTTAAAIAMKHGLD